jgi:hypothetical protein
VARLVAELKHLEPEKQDIERQRCLDDLVAAACQGFSSSGSKSKSPATGSVRQVAELSDTL